MTDTRYQIIFDGQLVEGVSEEQARSNIQALFGASDRRVEHLFTQTPVVMKSDLSAADAEHYCRRMADAGLRVEQVPMAGVSGAVEPEAPEALAPVHEESVAEGAAPEYSEAAESEEIEAVALREESEPNAVRRSPVEFTGKGSEYFGIWIVNILLTILTLGIYSAWASVRNKQYFYGNTHLDGSSFQYLANPLVILKGRIIAFIMLAIWVFVSEFYPKAAAALAISFIFVVPWIVTRSLRFNAVNSAYRNIRFDFKGSYGQAFMVTFVWPLVSFFTFFLLFPLALFKSHRFMVEGSHYGTTRFDFNAQAGAYFMFFLKGLGLMVAFGVVMFVARSMVHEALGIVVAVVGYLTLLGYFMAGITNLYVSNTSVDGHQLESNLEKGRMLWIYFSNSLMIALTLGLFTPWAKVRMARYRASCTSMLIHGDLNHFVATESERTSALGQEIGDAFDVGIAPI
ncbi:YjgN family protein [Marinobacteraceae bacterium S3BR75-40.1]